MLNVISNITIECEELSDWYVNISVVIMLLTFRLINRYWITFYMHSAFYGLTTPPVGETWYGCARAR